MTATVPTPTPFTVHVSDEELARMRRKIEDYALPEREIVPNSCDCWDYGVSLDWAKSLRDTWLNEFDWREVEEELGCGHELCELHRAPRPCEAAIGRDGVRERFAQQSRVWCLAGAQQL